MPRKERTDAERNPDRGTQFSEYLKRAIKATWCPGYPEVAFNILAAGKPLARVKERLGITEEIHKQWMKDYKEYAMAIELGQNAGFASIVEAGSANLESPVFQSKMWSELSKIIAPPSEREDKSDGNEIVIRIEDL